MKPNFQDGFVPTKKESRVTTRLSFFVLCNKSTEAALRAASVDFSFMT